VKNQNTTQTGKICKKERCRNDCKNNVGIFYNMGYSARIPNTLVKKFAYPYPYTGYADFCVSVFFETWLGLDGEYDGDVGEYEGLVGE